MTGVARARYTPEFKPEAVRLLRGGQTKSLVSQGQSLAILISVYATAIPPASDPDNVQFFLPMATGFMARSELLPEHLAMLAGGFAAVSFLQASISRRPEPSKLETSAPRGTIAEVSDESWQIACGETAPSFSDVTSVTASAERPMMARLMAASS